MAAFLIATTWLFADGGQVLLRKQSGPLVITVFGAPQAGASDISVLVQRAADRSAVLDATVWLRIADFQVRAIHKNATNKLLYAAPVKLAHAGKLHLQITVTTQGRTEIVYGDIDVAPETPAVIAYWPYFALVPAAILLFAVNQRLKSKRRVRRLEAPP